MKIDPYELQFDNGIYVQGQYISNLSQLLDVIQGINNQLQNLDVENNILKKFLKDNVARINFSIELQQIISE